MRGAITLAAVLAVPVVTTAGRPLAGRDEIIYLGFAVIVVTLVAQGMTLPAPVRQLRLTEHPAVADAELQARLELTRAALDHLGDACVTGELPEELADGLRAQYLGRLHRLETMTGDEDGEDGSAATAETDLAIRRELIEIQRRTLTGLRDHGQIGITTLRTIEHDLDLEEAGCARPEAGCAGSGPAGPDRPTGSEPADRVGASQPDRSQPGRSQPAGSGPAKRIPG